MEVVIVMFERQPMFSYVIRSTALPVSEGPVRTCRSVWKLRANTSI